MLGRLFSREMFDTQLEKKVDDESLSLSSSKRKLIYELYPTLIAFTGMLEAENMLEADLTQINVRYHILILILLVMFIMAWHKGVNRFSYLRQLSIAWVAGGMSSFFEGGVQIVVFVSIGVLYLFGGVTLGERLGMFNGVLKYTGALIALPLPMLLFLEYKIGLMMCAGLIIGLDVFIAAIVCNPPSAKHPENKPED